MGNFLTKVKERKADAYREVAIAKALEETKRVAIREQTRVQIAQLEVALREIEITTEADLQKSNNLIAVLQTFLSATDELGDNHVEVVRMLMAKI